jgi:hypothetical protein
MSTEVQYRQKHIHCQLGEAGQAQSKEKHLSGLITRVKLPNMTGTTQYKIEQLKLHALLAY